MASGETVLWIDPHSDTKKKLSHGETLIKYLEVDDNPVDCEDVGGFIDSLVPWMQSSNFKVWVWSGFLLINLDT